MSRALDPLKVKRTTDGRRRLLSPLRVDVSRLRDGTEIVKVCKGFTHDYSSLPWGLRWVVNWDRVDIAGVAHDYLYRTTPNFTAWTRWQADLKWFRVALSGEHHANWVQAALGLVGLYLGACWVMPSRQKCTPKHLIAMAIVELSILAFIWAVGGWRVLIAVLGVVGVVVAVNVCQSRGGGGDEPCPEVEPAD